MDVSENVGNLYFILEYTGVALAATVGGTVAKRMNFDIVGFAFVALISSLAGGLARDAILNTGPAAALTNPGYLITATCGALLAYFVRLEGELWEKFRLYADVVTVGVWAVGGTLRGLEAGLSWVPCILLSILTAVGGTMARDIVLRRVPSLFTEQKMYVFPAVLASVMMLVLNSFGWVWQGMLASAIAAPVLSIALYFGANHLPLFKERKGERPLEEKLARALLLGDAPGGDDTSDDAAANTDSSTDQTPSPERVIEALEDASDEQLINALRTFLINEIGERSQGAP